jgi:hypothetical protein
VKICEERLPGADTGDLRGDRLLDLEDEVGPGPEVLDRRQLGAGGGVFRVGNAAAIARAGLDQDAMTCLVEGASAGGREGYALLAHLDLAGHPGDHDDSTITMIPYVAAFPGPAQAAIAQRAPYARSSEWAR